MVLRRAAWHHGRVNERRAKTPWAGIWILALLGACSESSEDAVPEGPTRIIERVELAWVTRTELGHRTDGAEGVPLEAVTLSPRTKVGVANSLPALSAVPPAELVLDVPEDLRDSVFEFRAGVDGTAYEGPEGEVGFEVWLGGERRALETVRYAPHVPLKQREWQTVQVELDGAAEVVLRTSHRGEGAAPLAGFGEPRLVVREEVPVQGPDAGPNLVLIVIDTLRADALSSYGAAPGTTPVMDELAERGVRFEQAFSAAPWTWPSTASILTGLQPPEHGVLGRKAYRLADEWLTLAEVLLEAGVATSGFSANPLIAANRNFAQGFQHFRSYPWRRSRTFLSHLQADLEEHADERFFLYVHWTDPHAPYEPHPDARRRFVGETPEGYEDQVSRELVRRYFDGETELGRRMAEVVEHEYALYRGEVATVDTSLGILLGALAAHGVLDNTIVAVTSDHGEEFLDHGQVGHGKQLYAESMRVPLIVAGPGIEPGGVVSEPVENRHLAGSLLELMGIERRGNLAGPNLFAAAERSGLGPCFFHTSPGFWVDRGSLLREEVEDLMGLRTDEVLYMWSPAGESGVDRQWLFDLSEDPDAQTPVPADEAATARLREQLDAWWRESREASVGNLSGDAAMIEELQALGYLGD